VAESDIRQQICAILGAVNGMGRVHEYQRFASDWSGVLAKFKDPDGRINAWTISRVSSATRQVTIGEVERAHVYGVTGIYGLQDDIASEIDFQALVERAWTAFNDDETLNRACVTTHPDWGPMNGAVGLQIDKIEIRMFGNVLCHVADCRLCAVELI
jgi:hypothetical protein